MSLKWYGNAIISRIENEADIRLVKCAEDLKGRSVEQAPVDTGDLRGNCAVSHKPLEARVGYSLPYALVQHENLQFKHPQGGKAKYLEDPFNEQKDNYIAFCGQGLIR